MAVFNIFYPIYPLSTRTEKGYTTKIIPFFFVQHTSIYDKRDDFNFHITNFPYLSSNVPASPAYGALISQLIRYAQAWSSYKCFILRATRLSNKLLENGNVKKRLKSSLKKFYGRNGDLKIRSFPLTNAKWHYVAWPNKMINLQRSDFIPIRDLFTEFDLLPTYERFP